MDSSPENNCVDARGSVFNDVAGHQININGFIGQDHSTGKTKVSL